MHIAVLVDFINPRQDNQDSLGITQFAQGYIHIELDPLSFYKYEWTQKLPRKHKDSPFSL